MKINTIIGARPQFIKAAPVSRKLRNMAGVKEIIIHTGQHYDNNMSDIFFKELEIPFPDYNLGIGSNTHGAQTGRMLEEIERVLLEEKPDWVLVYGDTNSTLAGALAAAKLHIPIAHVEAGLRSYNRLMAEEINRAITDNLSMLLFAPTSVAVNNLLKEGISDDKIKLVGDVMYDAALYYSKKAEKESNILDKLLVTPKSYILVTIHRAENTDNFLRLQIIFDALVEIRQEFPVVLPLHPRTRKALMVNGILKKYENQLMLIEPVGYLDMVMLEKNACLIATDSGGVQKEAFFYRVPCLTLRDETEWTELVELRWNRLAPLNDSHGLSMALRQSLDVKGQEDNPYGDGSAAKTIRDVLLSLHSRI